MDGVSHGGGCGVEVRVTWRHPMGVMWRERYGEKGSGIDEES